MDGEGHLPPLMIRYLIGMNTRLLQPLRDFADSVRSKFAANVVGEKEAQLSGPCSALLEACGKIILRGVVAKAESRLGDRLGIPDFAILAENALVGYFELKVPGHGANTDRYTKRDKEQWERFRSQPNILYTDGNEWCLYQNGEAAESLLRFDKDITKHGAKGVTEAHADHFQAILTRFLSWSPIIPKETLRQAELLAPLCLLLREDVADALRDKTSPLVNLAKDWRTLLFPEADNNRFADAYAQTVTFALLLARSEGADVESLANATAKLEADHSLLSRALQVLTDPKSRAEIEPSLRLLQRVIGAFPDTAMKQAAEDPWLHFYEHFLAAYDPKLRKDVGAYYTPVQVVECQVALVDELLRKKLKKPGGYTHKDVITLDPAVGTGTYLLGVIDRALASVAEEQGEAAVPGKATSLATRLFGFELLTGPYAVAELRVTRTLKDRGAELPATGLGILLADTLESPFAHRPEIASFLKPISDHHARAMEIKDQKSVIVCIGNPPYDRHDAVGDLTRESMGRSGGWIRWGEYGDPETSKIGSFLAPAKAAGHGGHLKNLYNLYVYFWRWAIWKVFEQPPIVEGTTRAVAGSNAGIVSFITASSYLRGDAFCGMRKQLRELCHEIYIIDLNGEGRGTRQEENVFNILSPVAICIAVRTGKKKAETPADVKYTRVRGTRKEKYAKLAAVKLLADLTWAACPTGWLDPFRPAGTGVYFDWPLLTDLMPWQSSGAQIKRTWPIAPDATTLGKRWKALLLSDDRSAEFVETRDRKVSKTYPPLPGVGGAPQPDYPLSSLKSNASHAYTRRYAYRSFDRHCIIPDNRIGDYMRVSLWYSHSTDKQIYFSSLFTQPLGRGPATVASADIPDMHHFRGSFGAKDVFPLYRDAAAAEPNILPEFLALWGKKLKRTVDPESFAAYLYAILGHGAFVEKFWVQLEDRELRIPLTLKPKLFDRAVSAGRRLLFLHTYGERCVPEDHSAGEFPQGSAKVRKAIGEKPADYPDAFRYDPDTRSIHIASGEIGPVAPEVWSYEVSGFPVVQSWLGYRMKNRKGKKSSPLDRIHPERWTSEFTDEFLRLLSILEQTLGMQKELTELLDGVVAGDWLPASELPAVPSSMKVPPRFDGKLELTALDEYEGDDSESDE